LLANRFGVLRKRERLSLGLPWQHHACPAVQGGGVLFIGPAFKRHMNASG
jgi:hypothetical protein